MDTPERWSRLSCKVIVTRRSCWVVIPWRWQLCFIEVTRMLEYPGSRKREGGVRESDHRELCVLQVAELEPKWSHHDSQMQIQSCRIWLFPAGFWHFFCLVFLCYPSFSHFGMIIPVLYHCMLSVDACNSMLSHR